MLLDESSGGVDKPALNVCTGRCVQQTTPYFVGCHDVLTRLEVQVKSSRQIANARSETDQRTRPMQMSSVKCQASPRKRPNEVFAYCDTHVDVLRQEPPKSLNASGQGHHSTIGETR
jgi:hypothetical protein